jgi:hypothetical protein
VLLIDGPFQFSLLTWALIVSSDYTALLRDVHKLGTLPAIRAFRMNCPVASDVRGRLLCHRNGAQSEQQQSKTDQMQFPAEGPRGILQSRLGLANWIP